MMDQNELLDFTVLAMFDVGKRELHVMVAVFGDVRKDIDEQHEEPRMNEGFVPVYFTVAAHTAAEATEQFKHLFWEFYADEI